MQPLRIGKERTKTKPRASRIHHNRKFLVPRPRQGQKAVANATGKHTANNNNQMNKFKVMYNLLPVLFCVGERFMKLNETLPSFSFE